jgi:hypothetical protein
MNCELLLACCFLPVGYCSSQPGKQPEGTKQKATGGRASEESDSKLEIQNCPHPKHRFSMIQ